MLTPWEKSYDQPRQHILGQEDLLEKGQATHFSILGLPKNTQLVKDPPAMQETWVRSLGWEEGKGYPLQYSGLENSMDYTVHGLTKSWTGLSDFHFHFQQRITCLSPWSLSVITLFIHLSVPKSVILLWGKFAPGDTWRWWEIFRIWISFAKSQKYLLEQSDLPTIGLPLWLSWWRIHLQCGILSVGWEDPLEKGKATHSNILAWRIPWTG